MDMRTASRRGRREPREGVREVSDSKKTVDPALLEQMAGKFDSNAGDLDRALKDVQGIVDDARPYWGGKAGLGFQSAAEMWGQRQTHIITLLRETAELARQYARISTSATQDAEQAIVTAGNSYDLPALGN